MIGIIVQLAISWLIVWFVERKDLRVLGFFPTKQRLLDFALFFLVAAICSASGFFLKMYFADQRWQLNPQLSTNLLLKGIWRNVASVMFEELIFRGVLFYILIKRIGAIKAVIISSVAFGIYHWFSHETFGNPVQMAFTFFTTGAMGIIYAYGYAKSFSLYIPCAIHLGWNLIQSVVFSTTVIGGQLFTPVLPFPEVTVSWFTFLCILLLPILSVLLINFFLLKKHKQAIQP